jgi:hypothetical protein
VSVLVLFTHFAANAARHPGAMLAMLKIIIIIFIIVSSTNHHE